MQGLDLHYHVEAFIRRWGPPADSAGPFIDDLRDLLEHYGKAALKHQSLPDSEHEHGDPV